jgi:uncharacterized protein
LLVAVVSDTHRDRFSIDKVIEKCQRAEVLIHLGDNVDDARLIKKNFSGRVINVKGNCDFASSVPAEHVEIIGNKKIFITHGHRYGVKGGIHRLQYRAEELEADIVLYGHTHISMVEREKDIWFINPGSASESRNGCESMALIEITEKGIFPTIISL